MVDPKTRNSTNRNYSCMQQLIKCTYKMKWPDPGQGDTSQLPKSKRNWTASLTVSYAWSTWSKAALIWGSGTTGWKPLLWGDGVPERRSKDVERCFPKLSSRLGTLMSVRILMSRRILTAKLVRCPVYNAWCFGNRFLDLVGCLWPSSVCSVRINDFVTESLQCSALWQVYIFIDSILTCPGRTSLVLRN